MDYKEEINNLSKSLINSMTAHQHSLENIDAMREEITELKRERMRIRAELSLRKGMGSDKQEEEIKILKEIIKDLEIDLLNNDS